MRLRITLNYPIEEVKELVKFASKGINHKGLRVWIKNSRRRYAGRYYQGWKISARLGTSDKFPFTFKYPRLKRAPEYTLNDWKEALVTLIAHELRHHQQYKRGKPMSEVDAERWAYKKLLAYRASQS